MKQPVVMVMEMDNSGTELSMTIAESGNQPPENEVVASGNQAVAEEAEVGIDKTELSVDSQEYLPSDQNGTAEQIQSQEAVHGDGGISRRGRKCRNVQVNSDTTPELKKIKNIPIFTTEEDKTAFENSMNVEFHNDVDDLYKEHFIKQDLNENVPVPLPAKMSSKLRVFSCNQCSKVLMSQSQARLHCILHTELRPFKCFKCDYATNIKGRL